MEPAISVLIIPFMILVYIPVLVAHKIGTMMSPLKLVDLNVVVVLSMIRLLTNAYVQLIGHIQMVLLVWHVISHSIGTSLKKPVLEDVKTSHSSTRPPNNVRNVQQEAFLTSPQNYVSNAPMILSSLRVKTCVKHALMVLL